MVFFFASRSVFRQTAFFNTEPAHKYRLNYKLSHLELNMHCINIYIYEAKLYNSFNLNNFEQSSVAPYNRLSVITEGNNTSYLHSCLPLILTRNVFLQCTRSHAVPFNAVFFKPEKSNLVSIPKNKLCP